MPHVSFSMPFFLATLKVLKRTIIFLYMTETAGKKKIGKAGHLDFAKRAESDMINYILVKP